VRGTLSWRTLKGPYDDGLVARVNNTIFVRPVSAVAASVLHRALAGFIRQRMVPLQSVNNPTERGLEFERQVRALLEPARLDMPTFMLDGTSAPTVRLRVDYMLPFDKLSDTRNNADGNAVIYIPTSDQYRCDGIIVPASDDTAEPIIIVETSITDSRSGRVNKILGWGEPGGLIMRRVHPTRHITTLLCWTGNMSPSKGTRFPELDAMAQVLTATGSRVNMRVLDESGLVLLGVLV
jgi:hypothetical protein